MTDPRSTPHDTASWDTEVLRRLGPGARQDAPDAADGAAGDETTSKESTVPPGTDPPDTDTDTATTPWESRQARRLAGRSATTPWQRRVAALSGVFRSDDEPERRTRATARCQTAVSTGRRVGVVAAHGGAGATTVTAGLGLVLAGIRNDSVAVLAGGPDRQVLQHRLGCDRPSSTSAVRDLLVAHQSDPNVASLEHLAVPGAPGLRAVTDSEDRGVVADCADHLSRRHAITLVDAGTRTDHPALGSAHGVVVVGRLSLDGVAQVHQTIGELTRRVPAQRLQVVLVATGVDTGLSVATAEKLLERRGVPVDTLPLDLHLATGVQVSVAHLSDPAAIALTEVAARALDIVTARVG